MRVIVVYKVESDHARSVVTFLHDFDRQTGKTIEVINPETREGIMFCQTYGLMQYPTMVCLDDSGVMQNMWAGLPLPTISEVSYYA